MAAIQPQQSIGEILDDLLRQLNASPNAVPIRWVRVDEDLLSDDKKRIDEAERQLASGLALVVFDPVALYSPWMRAYVPILKPVSTIRMRSLRSYPSFPCRTSLARRTPA